MTVRPATGVDVDGVLALIRAMPQLPQWKRDALAPAGCTDAGGPVRVLLLAEDHGDLLGFAQTATVLDETELESIAVWPGSQRQGVGRLLLEAVMQSARAGGASVFRLEVRASNRAALRLYEAAGMAVAGRRRRYYADPVEDAILLERTWR